MPEIDENQLAAFRTLQDFYAKAANNPATRKLLKQLEKQVYPESAVPEIDAAEAVKAEVAEQLKSITDRMDAWTKTQSEREEADKKAEIEKRWLAGQKVAKDSGYTKEGLEQLEAFMQERGIFDHDIAIPAFERLHPPPEPATVGSGEHWNFFDVPKDDESLKQYLETGDDERFLREMVPEALRDVRGGRR